MWLTVKKQVSWNFTTMPSEDWKDGVGTALTQYAADTGKWDDVVKAFVDKVGRQNTQRLTANLSFNY